MEHAELTALMNAGTVHNFHGQFGGRPEGARGTVVKVGAPLDPNVVWVRTLTGTIRNWDRRTMSAT
jgi:hypothetical protein